MTALKYNNYQVSCFSDQSITAERNRSQLGDRVGHFLTQLYLFTIFPSKISVVLLSVFGNQYLALFSSRNVISFTSMISFCSS